MRILLAIAALVCASKSARGQLPATGSPSPQICSSAADSLAAGITDVGAWDVLGSCGEQGVLAVAKAITASRASTDTAFLGDLLLVANAFRHPTLLDSAIATASDGGASTPARILAFLVLVYQYQPSVSPFAGDHGWSDLLAATREVDCGFGYVTGEPEYSVSMAADFVERIAATAETVIAAPATPEAVSVVARCVRGEVSAVVPEGVPDSAVQLQYVCGVEFRVTNSAASYARLEYSVATSPKRFGLFVPPSGETSFLTFDAGSVSLYQNGRLLATVPNTGRICP